VYSSHFAGLPTLFTFHWGKGGRNNEGPGMSLPTLNVFVLEYPYELNIVPEYPY
jgi:hypothetical protein